MADSLTSARSLLWMLARLKERGQFYYSDWAAEFRPDEPLQAARSDRNFHNHLRVFKEEALDLLRGDRHVELLTKDGLYYLERPINETKFETFADPQAFNFLPLLHGLNNQNSLIPFPSTRIEKLLIDGYDVPEGTMDRIVYKSSTPWRFNPAFIDTFLNSLASQTQLFIRPEPGRTPCHVTPLFLVNYGGAWHLLALRGGLLQYNLSRVEALEASDVPAEKIPKDKMSQLRTSIQENFGINLVTDWPTLSRGQEVTVRFKGNALRYARERFDPKNRASTDLWYQAVEVEGGIDVTLRVQAWWEVISEALRWGADAEAVSPPEFREAWLVAVRKLAASAGV